MKEKVAVLGAGSWGTALAILLANKGLDINLWEPFPDLAENLRQSRVNSKFLPGVPIPPQIFITSDLSEAVREVGIICMVLPSHVVREGARRLAKCEVPVDAVVVTASKGIENVTNLRMSEVIASELPNRKIVVLSGPSHAEEVSRNIPTSVVVASPDVGLARHIQGIFVAPNFRVYTSQDLVGVELGGALKNIIAIAAGICDGLGLGDNTKAALMTRGLAEIAKLGVAMGAKRATFAGLAGMGDLIVTCVSSHSRNRGLGEALGRGQRLQDVLKGMVMVAEGVRTTKSAYQLCRKYRVKMPITEAVYGILFNEDDPHSLVFALMEGKAGLE